MQKWYAGETISLGIGQGYNAFTMLQLAQADRDGRGRRPALHAAPGAARSRTIETPRRSAAWSASALPPLPWKPEHVAFIHQRALRRDAGRHLGAARSSTRPTSRAARPAPRR